MKKPVVHFEIGCNDLGAAHSFYQNVFDWQISPEGRSATIDTGVAGSLSGHITQLDPTEPQQYITIYIETDSLAADLKAVVVHGGHITIGPIELPDGRFFAWIKDIAGNTVGLITPMPKS